VAKILPVSDSPSSEFLEEVRQCTSEHGVVAFATESFYALGASAFSRAAVDRVAQLKGRPSEKPLLVLIGEREQLDSLILSLPPAAMSLMDHFWPGPLTLILPARHALPAPLLGESGTIGIRCPGTPELRTLLCQTGPLTGTSANRTGYPPLTTAQGVLEFGEGIDLILDSGPSPGGLPSTLVTLVEAPSILRQGPITERAIQAVLGKNGTMLVKRAVE